MTTIEQALGEFIDDWKAGRRPDVERCLSRVAEPQRETLAAQLRAWLEIAPTPAYDAATRAAIAREPALRAALAAAEPMPRRLAALRERAGLAVRDVAHRLAGVFAIDDERRAADYLTRVERGDLDPERLSRRLLEALASILGADPDTLALPAPAAGQALFRADGEAGAELSLDLDALSRAALAPAPEPMDELDRLFLGGPEG